MYSLSPALPVLAPPLLGSIYSLELCMSSRISHSVYVQVGQEWSPELALKYKIITIEVEIARDKAFFNVGEI